jgi:DegV family protein with EDD domain
MLRIVMDGAGDMPAEWGEEFDIQVIPVSIHFKEQTYTQGVDLSNEDFYQMVEKTGEIPKTSQPTPQQFIDFYKKIAEPGDTILSMHVTKKLSGTFESAQLAARELEDEYQIIALDSANGSAGIGFMCRDARLMERRGASVQQVVAKMEEIRRNISIALVLDTLDYARMSGRVKTLQAAFASILNVKPIVELIDGDLRMSDKVRTMRRALLAVIDKTRGYHGEKKLNVAVVQARTPKSGEAFLEQVRISLNCNELIMTDLSIAVAANLGPGAVGIVAYPVEEG